MQRERSQSASGFLVIPRREPAPSLTLPPAEFAALQAVRYWKSQAERYERIAAYSWVAWTLGACIVLTYGVLEAVHP